MNATGDKCRLFSAVVPSFEELSRLANPILATGKFSCPADMISGGISSGTGVKMIKDDKFIPAFMLG